MHSAARIRELSSLFDWVKKNGDDNNFVRKSAVEDCWGRTHMVSHGKSGGKDLNLNLEDDGESNDI